MAFKNKNASSLVQSLVLVPNGGSWDTNTAAQNPISRELFPSSLYRLSTQDLNIVYGVEVESINGQNVELEVELQVNGIFRDKFTMTTVGFHRYDFGDVKTEDVLTFKIGTTIGNASTRHDILQVYAGKSQNSCTCP